MRGRPLPPPPEDAPSAVEDRTAEASEIFARAADRQEYALLNHPRLTKPQREFSELGIRFGLWVGGNSIGKSWAHAWDLVHFTRGTHPFRPTPKGPRKVLVAGFSFAQMDPLMEKLWMMLPKGEIHPKLYYSAGQGIKGFKEPVVQFVRGPAAGSTIYLATYEQGADRIMGFQGHRVSFDEPPPSSVYAEARPRLNRYRGELRITMTPTPDSPPLEYLRKELEDEKLRMLKTSYNQENITIRGGLVPWAWKTQAEIDEDIAGYLPDERPMREHGDWDPVVAGRWCERVTDENITTRELPADGEWYLAVAADHGTRPGRQCATLVAGSPIGEYWLLDEARTGEVTSTTEDAKNIIAMLRRNGLRWDEVDHWIGDRATSESYYGAAKSNQDLQREIASELGMSAREAATRGIRFQTMRKGPGSLRRGVGLINTMAHRKRLWINKRCQGFIKFAKEWTGDLQSELKDPGDSGRYGLVTLHDRQDMRKIGSAGRIM